MESPPWITPHEFWPPLLKRSAIADNKRDEQEAQLSQPAAKWPVWRHTATAWCITEHAQWVKTEEADDECRYAVIIQSVYVSSVIQQAVDDLRVPSKLQAAH